MHVHRTKDAPSVVMRSRCTSSQLLLLEAATCSGVTPLGEGIIRIELLQVDAQARSSHQLRGRDDNIVMTMMIAPCSFLCRGRQRARGKQSPHVPGSSLIPNGPRCVCMMLWLLAAADAGVCACMPVCLRWHLHARLNGQSCPMQQVVTVHCLWLYPHMHHR